MRAAEKEEDKLLMHAEPVLEILRLEAKYEKMAENKNYVGRVTRTRFWDINTMAIQPLHYRHILEKCSRYF